MLMPRLSPSLVRCAAIVAAALVPIAPRLAAAQVPVPTAEFAPYIGVRQITNALPDSPPPFAYIGRRIAVDRTGAFGGRIAVATDDYSAGPGRVDLVDPTTGALTPLGGSDLRRPNAVAMPWPGSFPDGVYYFQQFDFPGNPGASRKVYSLPPGAIGGLGSVLSSIGMDAGSGLAFAPLSFGPTFGGQLFGSDSGNAPGATSGDGIRRWDVAGNWTNEVMGPIANNPDSYTDVTFTGPEFGAFANRLVAINSTGVAGENILMWTEAALNGHSELDAYNTREVFAVTLSPNLPVYRAAYGTYGARGYLFAHNQSNALGVPHREPGLQRPRVRREPLALRRGPLQRPLRGPSEPRRVLRLAGRHALPGDQRYVRSGPELAGRRRVPGRRDAVQARPRARVRSPVPDLGSASDHHRRSRRDLRQSVLSTVADHRRCMPRSASA
jgi:hypothetical protein